MPYTLLQNESEHESSSDVENDEIRFPKKKATKEATIHGSLADEIYIAVGYKNFTLYKFLFHCIAILSGGALYLVTYWKPEWKVCWTKKKALLDIADTLILKDIDSVTHVVAVELEESGGNITGVSIFQNSGDSQRCRIRSFTFQYVKFIWDCQKGKFRCLDGLGNDTLISSLIADFRGFSYEEQSLREKLYGKNCITVEVKSYLSLLFTEVLNPFYIFQIASLILWALDDYYLYATCIFLISCLSIAVSLFETRKQSTNLKKMVEASNASHVLVLRSPGDLKPVEVDARDIVPGDVLVIPPGGGVMACDAVLISGNVIVNESMLTGESVPVTKTPLTPAEESERYSPEKHKRHTLFCGTNVIQTRYYGKEQVLAIVVRTGFSTAKGELVRSILYPRPIDFKFYADSMKFIGFMFFVSMIGMGYSLYVYISRARPVARTILRALDIVTIVVPPALPAAMTVGTYYAQNRLKKQGIFCISPPRINICGKLKLVCFDKTGTLTEDGLEVWGVIGTKEGPSGAQRHLGKPCHQVDHLDVKSSLVASLATCHSLTHINGELTGDPLDLQMFQSTKWDLVEPEEDSDNFDSLIPTLVRPSSKPLLSPPSEPVVTEKACAFQSPPISCQKMADGGSEVSPSHSNSRQKMADGGSEAFPSPPNSRQKMADGGSEAFPSPPNSRQKMADGGSEAAAAECVNDARGEGRPRHHLGGGGGGSPCFRNVEITVDPPPSLKFDPFSDHKKRNAEKGQDAHCDTTPNLTIEQVISDSSTSQDRTLLVIKPTDSSNPVTLTIPSLVDVAETSFQVPYEIGIVRQFPFSSTVQRMSVIVRVLGKPHMELYCKGAPEVIQSLCHPDTIPGNLPSVLTRFTVQGFRVIALAHKNLEAKLSWHSAQRVKRNQLECDMTFLGLLILQNVLKPETTPVIKELKKANIRSVMVTGDNVLTGICVARDCGMVLKNESVFMAKIIKDIDGERLVFEPAQSDDLGGSQSYPQMKNSTRSPKEDSATRRSTEESTTRSPREDSITRSFAENSTTRSSVEDSITRSSGDNSTRSTINSTSIVVEKENYHLAVTGCVWAQIRDRFPELLPFVVSGGTIFARMSPDQKVQLVEEFQELEYVVGMCGDGANDCGALKAAHVGISLSEAEASVAAPFTSHVPNITCVPKVICEGRGALTTNFSVFKYMALYSIIQFVSVLILYSACTNLSDPQFLYIDLFIVTSVAVFMGYTKAKHELVPERPLSNLIGTVNLFSVLSQIFLVIAIQTFAYYYLIAQPWYKGPSNDCSDPASDDIVDTWETNVLFCVSSFQYLSLGIIFSPGRPFREPLHTNICLLLTIAVFTLTSTWILIYPTGIVQQLMDLSTFPEEPAIMFRGTLLLLAVIHLVLGWSVEYFIVGSSWLKKVLCCFSRKKQPKNLYKRIKKQLEDDPDWPPVIETTSS